MSDERTTTRPPVRDASARGSTQRTGSPAAADLGSRLAALARQLQQQESTQEVLDRVVAAAVALVPGTDEATISRVRRRREVVSVAATTERAAAFDALQQEVGQGPCLDALYEHRTVRVDDLEAEARWPRLAERCTEVGVRSTLCFQLYVEGDTLGALNLLAAGPGSFDDESEDAGALFASHAAIAVADVEKLQHVQVALDSRDVIGQAKGVLMERFKITSDQAFALLSRASQDSNRKLREVADEVTSTGHLQQR